MNSEMLLTKLEEYGIDLKGIDDRFMGNFELLGRLINKLNYLSAFNAVHVLKGVAGNPGLSGEETSHE